VTHFGPLDWLLTALSLLGTLWIGVRTRRYVGGIEDYLVAGRGMGVYVGTASLVSTEIGIITYMYHAQFGFLAGFVAFVVGLITIGVCFAVGQTGFVISRLRELEIMTVPEYLERRYTRRVRVLADGTFAAGRNTIGFDGRDGSGAPLASGVYFVRLESGGRTARTRMVYLGR